MTSEKEILAVHLFQLTLRKRVRLPDAFYQRLHVMHLASDALNGDEGAETVKYRRSSKGISERVQGSSIKDKMRSEDMYLIICDTNYTQHALARTRGCTNDASQRDEISAQLL